MKHFIYAMVCLATLASCSRPSAVAVPSGGYAALRQECMTLLQDYRRTRKEFWGSGDSFPPAIASLKPQYVQIQGQISPPFVDIQTSGGFQHQGLLIVCDDTAKDAVPSKGRNWRITKVTDFVFEYRE